MPGQHSLFVSCATKVFEDLDVGAAIWQDGLWSVIHERSDLIEFELEHGVVSERFAYNERSLARMRRDGVAVLAAHGGFCDLFVPIATKNAVVTALVVGPFATARPSSTDLLERWRRLTGHQGLLGDPEFDRYVTTSLSTLVLEENQIATFRELLERLADQMASRGSAEKNHARIEALRVALEGARMAERVWKTARAMVDERTSRAWSGPARARQLADLGLTGFPDHVGVGLLVGRNRIADALDDRLRRHALQRACVDLAHSSGHAIAGQVGDHGVVFLSTARGPRDLAALVERARHVAKKRFALDMHSGLAWAAAPLPRQYQVALAAAEAALSRGVAVLERFDDAPAPSALGAMRQELGRAAEQEPGALPARFDRFLEVVVVRCGHRMDPVRAHLEAGLGRIAEAVGKSGAMDNRSLYALLDRVEKDAVRAVTVSDLCAIHRRAVQDIADAESRPLVARHERSLRRAEEHMRQHYAEPLSLRRVAQAAGFAPSYFSALFHEQQGTTFADYLRKVRVERAMQLLAGTSLNLQRIAQLSGLSSRHYLGRVFKHAVGLTPMAYRRRELRRAGA